MDKIEKRLREQMKAFQGLPKRFVKELTAELSVSSKEKPSPLFKKYFKVGTLIGFDEERIRHDYGN